MDKLHVTPAKQEELPTIYEIYDIARNFMRSQGNLTQWADDFPPREWLVEDIKKGQLYTIKDEDEEIRGVFALLFGIDPTYVIIEEGNWSSDSPYASIHRIASDGNTKGIFKEVVEFSECKSNHLRIDTHEDNKIMQHLLEKHGFVNCGTIFAENGTPRMAYEKIIE